jgi:hypothetical protein
MVTEAWRINPSVLSAINFTLRLSLLWYIWLPNNLVKRISKLAQTWAELRKQAYGNAPPSVHLRNEFDASALAAYNGYCVVSVSIAKTWSRCAAIGIVKVQRTESTKKVL